MGEWETDWDGVWLNRGDKKDIKEPKRMVGFSHWIPNILCHLKIVFFDRFRAIVESHYLSNSFSVLL